MTVYHAGRPQRRGAAPGPCLITRPAADAVVAALFAVTVLAFLLALVALSA